MSRIRGKVAVRQHLHQAALKKLGYLGQRQRDLAAKFLADGLPRAAGLRNVPL